MKKLLGLLIFLSACGGGDGTETAITTSTTTTLGTTTTLQNNLRTLKIAIFDDSVSKKYDVISVLIVKPKNFSWSPDLEYGADDLLIPPMIVGELGEFILTFDSESTSIPICFSPTFDSKGDMGTIWIVLNDNNIEVDGLPVQDIVITRNDQSIKKLNDNSKPNCVSEEASTTTSTTVPTTDTTNAGSQPGNPGDTKNCGDFSTYSEAKAWFDTYFPYYGDVANLDGDNDGEPCESLPGGP